MTEHTKEIGLAKIVKPKFLSLVGSPANQVAFKIIRDDNGDTSMSAPHIQRKRTRRADSLISIEFEETVDDAVIAQTMQDWGVGTYTVETRDTKKYVKCSEATGDTIRVNMGEGRYATILKPISRSAPGAKSALSVVRIEFAADYFPNNEDVAAWLGANSVDFSQDAIQNGPELTVVRRDVKVEKEEETRSIQVDTGVQFVVARAEVSDVPENFIVVVNDAAFGNWGWGQLDFAAMMADVEFCKWSEEAIYTLNRIIDRILFYSELPIPVRKELIVRATSEFSSFIVTLMDALPARVVIASRSTLDKEKSMSNKKEPNGTAVKRQDEVEATTTEATTAATTAEATPAASEPEAAISRADVAKMIEVAMSGVATQLSDIAAKLTPATAAAAPVVETVRSDTPADTELTKTLSGLTEVITGMAKRLDSLEGGTTVRSDGADAKQTQVTKDVFRGVFGSGKQ